MIALPYPLFEQVKLLIGRCNGQILAEQFAADVTLTVRFRVEEFVPFQIDLQELSHGRLAALIIETRELIVPV
jgi:putative IMPACT (imprinted ancient) family translation regulator